MPTPFRRTDGMRIDKSDQHGLDTAYQIRQALACLGVGEAFWEQGRAWLGRSLGAWLRPVKQTTGRVWPQARSVWFIWLVWSIWLIQLVWFHQINKTNQLNETDQTDQMNKTGQRTF